MLKKKDNKIKKSDEIFIIFNDLGIGGVQRKIADIATSLSKKEEQNETNLTVILDSKKHYDLKEDIFLSEVKNSDAKVFYKPGIRLGRFKFPLSLYIAWKILLLDPDTIVPFMRRFSLIAVLMKYLFWWRKMKVVVSYDNVPSLLIRSQNKSRIKIAMWFLLIRLLYPRADAVIVPSDAARKDLMKNFNVPKGVIKVNKNWIPRLPKKRKARKKYDLVYTGRMDEAKNLSLFVEVVEELKKKKPEVKACIIGWGKQVDKIKSLVSKKTLEGNLELTGSQKDVGKYLASSRIFMLTSRFEGLPISALEAMAYKLPVVTINYPGSDELVLDGKTGFICKDKKELVERASGLLNNKKQRAVMGEKAFYYVKEKHGRKNLDKFIEEITNS